MDQEWQVCGEPTMAQELGAIAHCSRDCQTSCSLFYLVSFLTQSVQTQPVSMTFV
jgi:hypothetical protein